MSTKILHRSKLSLAPCLGCLVNGAHLCPVSHVVPRDYLFKRWRRRLNNLFRKTSNFLSIKVVSFSTLIHTRGC